MLPLMMNNLHNKKLYGHKPSDSKTYIFPILGLEISDNKYITLGHVMFVSKDFLINEILSNKEHQIIQYTNTEMVNTKTFAILNLEQYGDLEDICKDGNNSLALQIVKQVIGAIYISIYKNKRYIPEYEKRIIISHNSRHEVDEGFVSYIEGDLNQKSFIPKKSDIAENLVISMNQTYLENINDLSTIFQQPIKSRNCYQEKIFKSLELLYGTFSETYTNERVFKYVMIVNHIFKNKLVSDKMYNDKYIGGLLKILFDIVATQKIVDGKISAVFTDIYSRLRNNPLHGELDPYEEICLINHNDYIPLKKITMETLILLVENKELNKLETTEELINYLKLQQENYAKTKKGK